MWEPDVRMPAGVGCRFGGGGFVGQPRGGDVSLPTDVCSEYILI